MANPRSPRDQQRDRKTLPLADRYARPWNSPPRSASRSIIRLRRDSTSVPDRLQQHEVGNGACKDATTTRAKRARKPGREINIKLIGSLSVAIRRTERNEDFPDHGLQRPPAPRQPVCLIHLRTPP